MNRMRVYEVLRYFALAGLLIVATLLLLPKDPYGADISAAFNEPVITQKKVASATTKETTYKVLFMGDTMLARGVGASITRGIDPYVHIADKLKEYNVKIANIETTIAPAEVAKQAAGKVYTFNAPLQSIDVIKKHVDVAVLANNHTSDFGPAATLAMLQAFRQKDIITVGAGKTPDEAFAPMYIAIQPGADDPLIKIAVIAANDIENTYTKVTQDRAGSAYFDKNRIVDAIQLAKNANADAIFVMVHWGVEYTAVPSARQKEWGRVFIDAGADAVIGGHPHVVQPSELYKGRPIVYSMGNFIFDGMTGDARNGQMIEVPITIRVDEIVQGAKTKNTQRYVTVQDIKSIPTNIDNNGFANLVK
jgi:poly-gamma-glutamate synthesis protein (capsule biosynthesis protein)